MFGAPSLEGFGGPTSAQLEHGACLDRAGPEDSMQQTKFLAHCEECGHAYRVPSNERTYHCKECEGSVVVDEDEVEEEPAPARRSSKRRAQRQEPEPEYDDDDEEEHEDYENRRLSQRHRHTESNKKFWVVIALLVVIVMGGGGMYATGMFDRWFGGERDLAVVVDSYALEWGAGNGTAVVGMYHPDGIDDFRDRFNMIVARAGWTGAFPAVTSSSAKLTSGTPDSPDLGESHLVLADGGWVQLGWQFDPSTNRWYIYDLKTSPPDLQPRVDELKELWASSTVLELRPLFTKKTAGQLSEMINKSVKIRKWGKWPTLTGGTITGEEQAGTIVTRLAGAPVEVRSTFETSEGEAYFKWAFQPKTYEWYVTGYKLP